jgi:hypothetical protein
MLAVETITCFLPCKTDLDEGLTGLLWQFSQTEEKISAF